jgi:hypothetical protein
MFVDILDTMKCLLVFINLRGGGIVHCKQFLICESQKDLAKPHSPKISKKKLAKQNFNFFSGVIIFCGEVGTELDAVIQLSA